MGNKWQVLIAVVAYKKIFLMPAAYLLVADIGRFVPNAVQLKKKNIRSLHLNILRKSQNFPIWQLLFYTGKINLVLF